MPMDFQKYEYCISSQFLPHKAKPRATVVTFAPPTTNTAAAGPARGTEGRDVTGRGR